MQKQPFPPIFFLTKNSSCEWNFWGCNFFYFYIILYCWWQHNARIFPPQIYFFLWRKVNLLDKRSRMVRNHAFVMMKVKRLRQCLICGFLHLRLVFFSWPQKRKNVFPCSTDLLHQKTGAVWKQGATPTKSSLILKPFIITPCKRRRLRNAKRASKPESWFPLCRDHGMTIPKFWPKPIPRLFFSKAYLIIVADAVSVNFSGRCKFLQI